MKLPESLLVEIIGRMDACSEQDASDNRRARRVRLTIQTSLLSLNGWFGSTRAVVRVREISSTGISILHHARIRPGEEFVLRLPRHHAAPVLVRYRAVRCQQVAGSLFVVGAMVCAIDESHAHSTRAA